jgi:hypothetical protein
LLVRFQNKRPFKRQPKSTGEGLELAGCCLLRSTVTDRRHSSTIRHLNGCIPAAAVICPLMEDKFSATGDVPAESFHADR